MNQATNFSYSHQYAMCKVTQNDIPFNDIMKCYRQQPQSISHIYRSVLLSSRSRRNSAGSDSGSHSSGEEKEVIRSSSTLPVPAPNSQPPTPTRMSGTGSQFEFGEERGDLIMFYNQVYVPEVKEYIISFQQAVSCVFEGRFVDTDCMLYDRMTRRCCRRFHVWRRTRSHLIVECH